MALACRGTESAGFWCRRTRVTHLPCAEDSGGLGEVEARGRVVVVKADDEAGDSEGAHSSTLGITL